MAEGGWVALGAAIGTVGSVVTTLLNAWLSNKNKPDHFDRSAMKVLKAVLTDSEHPWHDLKSLASLVGLSSKETRQLLLMIGARGHESGSEAWALISRVGTKVKQEELE